MSRRVRSFGLEFELGQPRPAFVILLVHLQKLRHRESRGLHEVAALEHEGQVAVRNLERFLLAGHELLVGVSVRTMGCHAGMQGRTTGGESFSLCIVLSADVAHELRHAVAVVVRGLEGVLCHQPSRRKNHEI